METKTHWKKLENPDYIGAYSLESGKDLTVTIEKVVREIVIGTGGKKEECTIAHLKGQKPFILNRTNMKMIQKIYETPYIEEWTGKKLTRYVTKIKAFGEDNVECLRVRAVKPPLPKLVKSNKNDWYNCINALKNEYTINQLKARFEITKEIELQLISDANEGI